MSNTNQINKPVVVGVTVIKRGRNLQFVASVDIVGVTHKLEARKQLKAGKKTPGEALEAFMEVFTSGAEQNSTADEGELLSNCFAAMDDYLDIDETAELQEFIQSGSQSLVKQANELVAANSSGLDGVEKSEPLEFVIGYISVVEPAENKGICRKCLKEFDLHYIAGTTDLCMSHINPGFI